MKRIRFITFALLLCLIPCFSLFACTIKDYYLIEAYSSDINLGNVEGMNNEQEKLEGTTLTLQATPKEGATFICWIKNNKTIVEGKENAPSTLVLTYGKEDAGQYTALFRKNDNYQSILYAKLTDITIDDTTLDIASLTINWSRQDIISEEQNPSISFFDGFNNSSLVSTNQVYYFGKIGQVIEYKFSGEIVITAGNTTSYNQITFKDSLSLTSFDNPKTTTLYGTFGESQTITLTFEKL